MKKIFNKKLSRENLGDFHFLPVMNTATINMGMQISFHHVDFISFSCYPVVGFTGSYVSSNFNVLENIHSFP
jgi:hypothetical protein